MIIKILNIVKAILWSLLFFSVGTGWFVGAAYFVARSPKFLGYFMFSIAAIIVIGSVSWVIYESIPK